MDTDFDFFFGRWTVQHRRLKARLAGCDEWDRFGGTSHVRPLLGGHGNIDDNVIEALAGTYRAATLRAWSASSRTWSIWWLDGRYADHVDAPMVGRFDGAVGSFHADELFDGRPIRVRFLWDRSKPEHPRWEQAFSTDGGASWETNWEMVFSRQP